MNVIDLVRMDMASATSCEYENINADDCNAAVVPLKSLNKFAQATTSLLDSEIQAIDKCSDVVLVLNYEAFWSVHRELIPMCTVVNCSSEFVVSGVSDGLEPRVLVNRILAERLKNPLGLEDFEEWARSVIG